MTCVVYAKGRLYKVWRDKTTHCGYVEQLNTGLTTAWFVCMEGAEDLLNLRRERRDGGPLGLDHACRQYFAVGQTVYHPEHGIGCMVANEHGQPTYQKGA